MQKGFTLIELLIVIGILAILATTVVFVLNPGEILAQSRDSKRFNDMAALRNAISIYLVRTSNPSLQTVGTCRNGGANVNIWASYSPINIVTMPFLAYGSAGFGNESGGGITQHANWGRTVDGLGWVPVNLSLTPSGSPLAVLPRDPVNTATYFYGFSCNNTSKTFEINAALESNKFTTAPNDKRANDGGNNASYYEIGSNLAL